MSRVRVGILGTGNVVRRFHLPALLANPRAEVVALANCHPQSLASLAGQFGISRTYADFEAMARDDSIDAVVCALPNYLHAPASIAMLRHGKHVLCEKPMAASVAEAESMVAATRDALAVLMIAHVWRVSPATAWLREIIRANALGPIERVKLHSVVAGRGPDADSWFVHRAFAGGGALSDVGIHAIDTLSFLFDDQLSAARITATIENRFQSLEVEDSATVRIECAGGPIADVEAGWFHPSAPRPHGAVELFGRDGYASIFPTQLRVAGSKAMPIEPNQAFRHPDDDPALYAMQIDAFLDCIRQGRRPPCDSVQGLKDIVLLDAAYRAAHQRSVVELPRLGASTAVSAGG